MTQQALETGYSIYGGVFESAEMTRMISALDRPDVVRTRAGARHVLAVPAVRALATDSRLIVVARQFVGSAAVPFRATLFDKSIDRNWLVVWHQDTALPVRRRVAHPAWGPWSVKGDVLYAIAPASALDRVIALRVHLDDSALDNGPLRVLPATHSSGVLEQDQIEKLVSTVQPLDCVTPAGGVVAMRPLIVHASSKARAAKPRRVLHIEYAADTHLGDGIELAVA